MPETSFLPSSSWSSKNTLKEIILDRCVMGTEAVTGAVPFWNMVKESGTGNV